MLDFYKMESFGTAGTLMSFEFNKNAYFQKIKFEE